MKVWVCAYCGWMLLDIQYLKMKFQPFCPRCHNKVLHLRDILKEATNADN